MNNAEIIKNLEKKHLKENIPHFQIGDTISVSLKIKEGGKERIQVFTGTVIARKGEGVSETFSLHRVAYGEGMERVFILNSPRIEKIEVVKYGKVRRAKLYHLRGKKGKKARVKSRIFNAKFAKKEVESQEESQEESVVKAAEKVADTPKKAEKNESAEVKKTADQPKEKISAESAQEK